ncbi:hypothetical protein LOAG_09916 [Loa loa]|uniref:Beta-amyloid precursor protein C-terminal domain-containing protein n=1 Tax=Loa loa TaxID=7209 RepID=A0A1S0TRG7_LOALO|nr:hypothetical protein LOAG_09916 [Loa loa]EFO18580.2 hypothetical protein LOAG_09916 [Loa loa]
MNDDKEEEEEDQEERIRCELCGLIDKDRVEIIKNIVDDTDEDLLSNSKSVERELHVEIEPIVSEPVRVHDLPPKPSFARHEPLKHFKISTEDASTSAFKTSKNLLLVFVFAATVIFVVFAIVLIRQRPRRRGFIEVDVCTPGERHVNGMQVNGYENPTYSFFDNKA